MFKLKQSSGSHFQLCVGLILILNSFGVNGRAPTLPVLSSARQILSNAANLANCTVKIPKPASPFPANFVFPNSSMPYKEALWQTLQDIVSIDVQDPDARRTVTEVIQNDGYPVVNHTIETEDGYILTYYRIPHGRNNSGSEGSNNSTSRPPVILQHGLFVNAGNWIFVAKNDNLAYKLADAGYDVWLGNARGTLPSQGHTNKNITSGDYWDFSWEEMGTYDIPAAIDYVLNKTGYKKLFYIGHSMGTTMAFAGLSLKPEVSDKIQLLITLAPVGYLYRSFSAIRLAAPAELAFQLGTNIELFSQLFSVPVLNEQMVQIIKSYSGVVCDLGSAIICSNLEFLMCGFDYQQTNFTALPLYMGSAVNPTTLKVVRHYAQSMLRNQFSRFDYGIGNCQKYGQTIPPEYDVAAIRSKTVFMYSTNDAFAALDDVLELSTKFNQSNIKMHEINNPHWNHLDYMVGKNVGEFIATPVLKYLGENRIGA